IGLKIVLSIAAAIAMGIATIMIVIVLLIPFGLTGLIAVLIAKVIGLTWNPITIAIAIVVGSIALAAFISGVLLISVPMIVFFPAYSIYFFAARYHPLQAAMGSGTNAG